MSHSCDPNHTPRRPAVIVLGVPRSGTTLLKQMLNRHSELAIPSESYFLVALWERYRRRPNTEALLADLAGASGRCTSGELILRMSAGALPERAGFLELIQAVYQSYAEAREAAIRR